MAKSKGHTGTTAALGDKNNKKRRSNEAEDAKKFKKARPSICKAAEELICPILQGLPIDPVTAEDVSLCSCFLLIIFNGISIALHFDAHPDALHVLDMAIAFYSQGQIYEREEIAKYLEKEGDAAISPVTRKKFKNKGLFPSIHVRNTIEHLIESGIIEGELADTWKERMAKKREEEAEVKGWKEAAEKGDTDAMYELGLCYVHGKKGLEADMEEAYKWFKKGYDAGDVYCMTLAGVYQFTGDGTKMKESNGLVLIALAAEKGSDHACYLLGKFYHKGIYGITKDSKEAKFWLEKALRVGACEYPQMEENSVADAKQWLQEIEEEGQL